MLYKGGGPLLLLSPNFGSVRDSAIYPRYRTQHITNADADDVRAAHRVPC